MATTGQHSLLANADETLWAMNLRRAMTWRKRYSNEAMWPNIEDIYNHEYNDRVPHFNLIFILGQTLVPNLVFQSPGVINTPNKDGMVQWASLFDGLDNWWVQHSEMKDVLHDAVLAAYLKNTSIASIGYDFPSDSDATKDIRNLDGQPNRTRAENAAWIDDVPAHRFVCAPGTSAMRKCPWAAKLVTTPTVLLKGRKGLKNVRASKIPDEVMFHERDLWSNRDVSKYTAFWEIHNAETKEWCWLSTSGKMILPWEEDPLQVYGLPFSVLSLNKNTKSIFGSSDPRYVMTQHLEGDDCRWQGLKQRRISVSKFLYKSGALDEETINRLISVDTPAAIPVDLEMDEDIRKVIYEFTSQINYGLIEYQKNLLSDAQHILGMGSNQLGTFAPGRRSSREAGIVDRVNDTRISYRRTKVAEMAEDLVRKANRLMTQNWTGPLVQQVVGADAALYWVEADPKKLEEAGFGMDTRVNVESLAPTTRDGRKEEAANLLAMLSQMGEAGANTMPILTQLLSQFEWIDVSQVLPQSAQRFSMEAFQAQQNDMIAAGGLGQKAANNVQGINSLINRLPAEPKLGVDNGTPDGQ